MARLHPLPSLLQTLLRRGQGFLWAADGRDLGACDPPRTQPHTPRAHRTAPHLRADSSVAVRLVLSQFQIPPRPRAFIAFCLCSSVFFHFATQATRLIWTDYYSSNVMPGTLPVNVTFGLSIVFGVVAGITQGCQEGDGGW